MDPRETGESPDRLPPISQATARAIVKGELKRLRRIGVDPGAPDRILDVVFIEVGSQVLDELTMSHYFSHTGLVASVAWETGSVGGVFAVSGNCA